MSRGTHDVKLFVGGLDYNTSDDQLKMCFSSFGNVTDWIIMKFPESRRSKGFGFVTFSSPEEVIRCLQNQPIVIDGKTVELRKAEPPRSDGKKVGGRERVKEVYDPESKLLRKLFVGSLNFQTTKDDLKEFFEKFGEVEDTMVMKFPDTGRSRGFGFVIFKSVESVDNCQANRPHRLGGKDLETRRATPKEDVGKPEGKATTKRILVKGFNEDMTDRDVEDYFGKFGNVVKISQLRWPDSGKKRGYGFVEFEDHDTVDKVVLTGKHVINGERMETKKALSKQEIEHVRNQEAMESMRGNRGDLGEGFGGVWESGMGNMGGVMGNMGGCMAQMCCAHSHMCCGMMNMGNMGGNMCGGMVSMGMSGMGHMGGNMNHMGGNMNSIGGNRNSMRGNMNSMRGNMNMGGNDMRGNMNMGGNDMRGNLNMGGNIGGIKVYHNSFGKGGPIRGRMAEGRGGPYSRGGT